MRAGFLQSPARRFVLAAWIHVMRAVTLFALPSTQTGASVSQHLHPLAATRKKAVGVKAVEAI